MSKFTKYISYTVLILALAGVLAAGLFLITYMMSKPAEKAVGPVGVDPETQIDESVQKISRNYSEVLNEDGTRTATFTLGQSQYLDANGTYQPIDTNLVASEGDFAYKNETNGFRSYFSASATADNFAKFQIGDRSVAFSFVEPNGSTAAVDDNTIIYPNVYDGLDAKYTITGDEFLEELIARKELTVDRISQKIKLNGVYYKQQPDGSITFHDEKTKKIAWLAPAPVMYEQNNPEKISSGLHYEIQESGEGIILSKVIDQAGKQWLKTATFPVVIEPTYSPPPYYVSGPWGYLRRRTDGGIISTFLHYTPGEVKNHTVYTRHHYQARSYLSFDTSSIVDSAVVQTATLAVTMDSWGACLSDGSSFQRIYSCKDTWSTLDSSTWNSCLTTRDGNVRIGTGEFWGPGETVTINVSPVNISTIGASQFNLDYRGIVAPNDDVNCWVQYHIGSGGAARPVLTVTYLAQPAPPNNFEILPATTQDSLTMTFSDQTTDEDGWVIQTSLTGADGTWIDMCDIPTASPSGGCYNYLRGEYSCHNTSKANYDYDDGTTHRYCTVTHYDFTTTPNSKHYYRIASRANDVPGSPYWIGESFQLSTPTYRYTLASPITVAPTTVTSPGWNYYQIPSGGLPGGLPTFCLGARFLAPNGTWPPATPTVGTRYLMERAYTQSGVGTVSAYVLTSNPNRCTQHTLAEWNALLPIVIPAAEVPYPIWPNRLFEFGFYSVNGDGVLTEPTVFRSRYSRARRPSAPAISNITSTSMTVKIDTAPSDGFTKPSTPPAGCSDTICGDVNRDCDVTGSDVSYFVNYIKNGGGFVENWTGDVNGDGVINSLDILYLVDFFQGEITLNCGGANILNPAWTDYEVGTTSGSYINVSGANGNLQSNERWYDYDGMCSVDNYMTCHVANDCPSPQTCIISGTTWGGAAGVNLTGLTPNTCYTFQARSRNNTDLIVSNWQTGSQQCTLAAVPGSPGVSCNYDDDITKQYFCQVTITNPNGNPNGTQYLTEYSYDNVNWGHCSNNPAIACNDATPCGGGNCVTNIAEDWTAYPKSGGSWLLSHNQLTCDAGHSRYYYRVRARNSVGVVTDPSPVGSDTLPPCPVSVNHYDNPVCRKNSYLDGWPEDPQCDLADPFDPQSEDEFPVFWWWRPAVSGREIQAYQVYLHSQDGNDYCLAGIPLEQFGCGETVRLKTEGEEFKQPWRESEWNEVEIPQINERGIIFKQFFQEGAKDPTTPTMTLPNHQYEIIVRGVDNLGKMGAPSTLGVSADNSAYTHFEQPEPVNLEISRVNQENRITISTSNPQRHCDGEDFCNLTGLNNSGLQFKVVSVSEGGTEAPQGGGETGFDLSNVYKSLSVVDRQLSTNRRYCYNVRGYNGDCVDTDPTDGECDQLNDSTSWARDMTCAFTWANVPHAPRLIKQEGTTDTTVIIRSDDGNPHPTTEPTNEAGANTRYAMCVTKYSATDQVDFRRYVSPTTGFLGSCAGYPNVSNENDCTNPPYNSTWTWNDSCDQPNSYLTTPEKYWSVRGSGTGNGWGGDDGVLLTGLENSKYDFSFQARNGDKVPTQFGPAATLFLVRNNVVGWAWSSNAGWISLNCLNMWANPTVYGYSCNSADEWGLNTYYVEGREYNPLEGYAWSASGLALGGEWTEAENVSRVKNVSSAYGAPSLAVDVYGNPHLAWANRAGGDRTDIYYLKKENGEWRTADDTIYVPGSTPSVNVTNTNALASVMPSLALDSSGLPHLVWYEEGGGVFYLKWDTADNRWETILGWDFATANIPANRGTSGLRISPPGNNGNNTPHLVLDKKNLPHVVYTFNNEIYYKYWDSTASSGDGAWVDANGEAGGEDRLNVSNTGAEENYCSTDPKLALSNEAEQRPYIVWRQSDPNNEGCDETGAVYLRRWDGANWVTVSGDSDQGYNGANLHVNFGVAGYVEENNPPDNYHAESPNLALDSQNRPGVVWRDPNDIFYKKWNGVRWVPSAASASFPDLWVNYDTGKFHQNASRTGSASGTLQIAITMKDDLPQISWGENAPGFKKEVVFRYWNQQHWTTISGAGNDDFVHRDDEDFSVSRTPQDASLAPSMSFDAFGNPHIAWLEYTYDWDDGDCVTNGEGGQTCCASNNDCANPDYPYCVNLYPDSFCSAVDIKYSKWDQTPKNTGLGWVSLYAKVCKDDTQHGCFDDDDCGGVAGSCQESAGTPPDGVLYGFCYNNTDTTGEKYGVCSNNNTIKCTEHDVSDCNAPDTATCILETCISDSDCPDPESGVKECRRITTANFNGTTREIEGWARILSKKDEGLINGFVDWGWIHLNGNYDDGQGNAGTYGLTGTEVDSQNFLGDPDVNPNNVKLYSLFGWAWQSQTAWFPDKVQSGVGWIEFMPVGALLGIPYLQTQYSDIYAGQNISLAPPPRGSGYYTSTYLILANGDIQGIPGYYAQTQTGLPTSQYIESGLSSLIGGSCSNTNYHTQADCEAHLGTWTQGAGEPLGTRPLSRINITDLITQVSGSNKNRFGQEVVTLSSGDLSLSDGDHLGPTPVLNSKVYYVNGNASVDYSTITFMKGGDGTSGNGTIIINGNLEINKDIKYDDTELDSGNDNITDLPSAAFIVEGNIYINSKVQTLSAVFVAKDNPNTTDVVEGTISTGRVKPFSVSIENSRDDGNVVYVPSGSKYIDQFDFNDLSVGYNIDGQEVYRGFLRFPLDVPAGSEIQRAYLRLTAAGSSEIGNPEAFAPRIYLVNTGNMNSLDSYDANGDGNWDELYNIAIANGITAPLLTGWNNGSQWVDDAGAVNESPDLKSLIQHFVNMSDYIEGNSIGIVIKEGNAASLDENNILRFYTFDNGDPNYYPELVIEYSPRRTSVQVSHDASGSKQGSTYFNDTPNCIDIGWNNSRANRAILQFAPLAVPKEAEIVNARLRMEICDSGGGSFQMRYGLHEGYPAFDNDYLPHYYDTPKLDITRVAEVAQSLSSSDWANGTTVVSDDITRLVASFFDRDDYNSRFEQAFSLRLRRGQNEEQSDDGAGQYRSIRHASTVLDVDYRIPLRVSGLFVAKGYNFDRKYLRNLAAAEQIVYDGRVVANTPPGLSDFIKALPVYQRVTP